MAHSRGICHNYIDVEAATIAILKIRYKYIKNFENENYKLKIKIKKYLTKLVCCDIIVSVVEVWLSLVEYFVRDEGVAGSNPVTSTKTDRLSTVLSVYKFV